MIKSNLSKVPAQPTEFKLPSGGIPYGVDFPNTVVVKPYNIETEAILAGNASFIDKMQSIIGKVTSFPNLKENNFKLDDMLISDHNFILAIARSLTYGENYAFRAICPECGKPEDISIKVPEQLPVNVWDRKNPPNLEVKLPVTKDVVKFRYLTAADERLITTYENQLRATSKNETVSENMAYVRRFSTQILEVNGGKPDSLTEADTYMMAISGRDLVAFQAAVLKESCGIRYQWAIVCDKCSNRYEHIIPLSADFFRRNRI